MSYIYDTVSLTFQDPHIDVRTTPSAHPLFLTRYSRKTPLGQCGSFCKMTVVAKGLTKHQDYKF